MADLETTLAQLAKHGLPTICALENGWHCSVNMHVAAAGATFTVRSDFGLATPIIAAEQCAERIDTMLRGFGTGDTKAITHG